MQAATGAVSAMSDTVKAATGAATGELWSQVSSAVAFTPLKPLA